MTPRIANLCAPATLATVLFATFFAFSATSTHVAQSFPLEQSIFSNTTMFTQGWHARASAHPAGGSYEPAREDLLFVLQHSSPIEPNGFSLTLFAPDVAVDALGRVLTVQAEDFVTPRTLATKVADESNVPDTAMFGNQWRYVYKTAG